MGDSPKWVAEKRPKKTPFFLKKIKFTPKKYLFLHISSSYSKILGEHFFSHGSFPEVGQKQKTEKKGEERKTEGW